MKTIKKFLQLSIQLLVLSSTVFSQQCPPSVLKIQSSICDTPRNLRVSDIKCATIQLNWQGNKDQKYIIAASGTDNAANTLFETKAAEYSCDENGNCAAAISVKEGAKLNWNIQAICNMNGVTIYSPKVEGKEMVIPPCQSIAAGESNDSKTNNETIRVYPNPTTGYLTVEYVNKISGAVELKVFDVNGKTAFGKTFKAVTGINKYVLDLHNLLPGTYLLNLNNGGDIRTTKFVLVRK